MISNDYCANCILTKQRQRVQNFDSKKQAVYIEQVEALLQRYANKETNPWLVMKIDEIFDTYFEEEIDYPTIKKKYNQLLLDKEKELEMKIRQSDSIIEQCIRYVSAGNYIDFGTVDGVSDEVLEELLEQTQTQSFSKETIDRFIQDCQKAKEMVYCIDNCGEIVLDKIFIRILKEQFPHLHITAIVRGKPVLNDATMVDVKQVGLDKECDVIDSGYGTPGLCLHALSEHVKQCLKEADIILAKGQGNFEGLYGEGLNPYFLFLCKCELFQQRFQLKKYAPVFEREDQIQVD